MVIEALKAARDFIENDREALAESLTVNGEIVFEDDIDRGAMAEYANVLEVIDEALKAAGNPTDHCEEGLHIANAQPVPVREPHWYCIDKTGMATLCADEDDARQSAKLADQDWPRNAPYRAVQLCEYTPPAAQPAPVQDEHQAFIESLPKDGDDKMFMQIDHWASESYKRHKTSVRGQAITAADGYESHIIWATLRWAKENTPPAQPAPDCKETGVCVQTGLACFGQAAQPAPVQESVACVQDLDEVKRKHLVYEKGMDWKDPLYTIPPAQPTIPKGWKLVPVEPTDAMVQAAFHLDLSYMPGQEGADRAAVYRAMLAAAPEAPPAQRQPLTDEQSVELVRIEHWRQATMESGHWEETREMPRHIAERLLHHFDQASIVTTPPAAQPAPAQEGRDWSLLEATQESLREHMAEIKRLKEAQPAPVQAPAALADEVIGCFHAAEIEGLTEALANTTDERLKDLVERRLMYALHAAQETKEKSV
jgi:hypothetical protein